MRVRDQLKLKAKEVSHQPDLSREHVTMVELLEEGIEALLRESPEQWNRWEGESLVGGESEKRAEPSTTVKIRADLAEQLGLLAARLQTQQHIPITVTYLVEQAGRTIITQLEQNQQEQAQILQSLEELFFE